MCVCVYVYVYVYIYVYRQHVSTQIHKANVVVPSGKKSACQCRRCKFNAWIGKISSMKWHPLPEFLPGIFQEQRSLADYSSWGHKESDMTEQWRTTASIKQKQAELCNSKGFNSTCTSVDRLSRQKANTETLV